MSVMRFKRFTKADVLKGIGRELLDRFFGRVGGAGNSKKLDLPSASVSDDEYFLGVAKVLMSPEGLPDEVGEALYLVDEMANEEGHDRLHAAATEAGLKLDGSGEHTQAEFALWAGSGRGKVLKTIPDSAGILLPSGTLRPLWSNCWPDRPSRPCAFRHRFIPSALRRVLKSRAKPSG
jgi:hypothetical protein